MFKAHFMYDKRYRVLISGQFWPKNIQVHMTQSPQDNFESFMLTAHIAFASLPPLNISKYHREITAVYTGDIKLHLIYLPHPPPQKNLIEYHVCKRSFI